ncbi:MAG: hypothetical protein GF331_10095 [Chitinivibrionales bacterium]|nr:hypothetical protein [Chitinivibrionales bacterium]
MVGVNRQRRPSCSILRCFAEMRRTGDSSAESTAPTFSQHHDHKSATTTTRRCTLTCRTTAIALALALAGLAHGEVVLEISPETYDSLVANGATVSGAIAVTQEEGFSTLDFTDNGYLVLPEYAFDHETFSVEGYFKLDRYTRTGPCVSALLSAVYWTGSYTQGVDFRVGGGYLYPILPENAYSSPSDFVKPDGFTRYVRASLSQSVPAFVMGAQNAGDSWKEVYADHGLMLGEWAHVVAVWDGTHQHIYINGVEATDPWRVNGQSSLPHIDSQVQFTVGASFANGSRHFDGKMRFVRLHDGAMSAADVAAAYAALGDASCRCHIRVTTPLAGQGGSEQTEFSLDIDAGAACDVLSGTLELEFFTDADLLHAVASVVTDKRTFTIEEVLPTDISLPDGVVHVRIRCGSSEAASKAQAGSSAESPSVLMPLFVDQQGQAVSAPGLGRTVRGVRMGPSANERVYDLRGRRIRGARQCAAGPSGVVLIEGETNVRAAVRSR